MPLDDPKRVNLALYYIDERNQLCKACAIRLGFNDLDSLDHVQDNRRESVRNFDPIRCTECQAFATGVHPDLPRSIPSPEALVDNCPVCGGSRELVHHASCNRDLH